MEKERLRLIDLIFKSQRLDFDQWDALVMLNLANRVNAPENIAFASHNKISDETRISKSKVIKCIDYLKMKGFILETSPHTATVAASYKINERELVL